MLKSRVAVYDSLQERCGPDWVHPCQVDKQVLELSAAAGVSQDPGLLLKRHTVVDVKASDVGEMALKGGAGPVVVVPGVQVGVDEGREGRVPVVADPCTGDQVPAVKELTCVVADLGEVHKCGLEWRNERDA